MSILATIRTEIEKADGAVKAEWEKLFAHAQTERAAALAAFDAEVGKGSADLQTAWAKVKSYG